MQSIFRETFTRHLDKLDAVVASERMDPGFDADDSRRRDRVTDWVYRLRETRGNGASVDERSRNAMLAEGMSEADVGEVAAMIAVMQHQNLAAERTAPALPEAILFESRRHGLVVQHGEVTVLGFGRRDVADGLQEPAVVEPIHPLEGCELDGLEVAPRSASMDNLGLVEAIDRFGEGVVVRVADAAD